MTERRRNVYVGSLNVNATKTDLYNLFKPFGKVQSAYIATPGPDSKYTYAFVYFENKDHAKHAIEKLNGIFFQGRRLKVEHGSSDKDTSYETPMILDFCAKRDDQLTQHEANDRGRFLNQLKNIFIELCESPVAPNGVKLPNMSLWLTEIDRLPLIQGPSFGQKKPQCSLDLDVLDELSDKYWRERSFWKRQES